MCWMLREVTMVSRWTTISFSKSYELTVSQRGPRELDWKDVPDNLTRKRRFVPMSTMCTWSMISPPKMTAINLKTFSFEVASLPREQVAHHHWNHNRRSSRYKTLEVIEYKKSCTLRGAPGTESLQRLGVYGWHQFSHPWGGMDTMRIWNIWIDFGDEQILAILDSRLPGRSLTNYFSSFMLYL